MARLDLAYARSLLRVAEPADLVRVVVRRVGGKLSRGPRPPRLDADAVGAAPDALGRAPRVFPAPASSLVESYRAIFPEALGRFRTRAAAILAHDIDVFGVPRALGAVID